MHTCSVIVHVGAGSEDSCTYTRK